MRSSATAHWRTSERYTSLSPGLPRQTADRLIDELIMRSEELPRIRRQYAVVEGYEREGVRRRNIRTWAIFYRERDAYVDIIRIVHGGRDVNELNLGR